MKAETHILMALFKATVEQSTALTGQLKQNPKYEFNIWQKQGFKLLESMEKANMLNQEYLDNIGDIYHNINLEIKAAEEVLNIKKKSGNKSLEEKRSFTEKEIKAQEQANIKAEKLAKDQAQKELDIFTKTMYSQIEALKELAKMEEEISGEDSVEAELARLEKLQGEWDGFADEIAADNMQKMQSKAQEIQDVGFAMLDT
jgi:hypothetical protein